ALDRTLLYLCAALDRYGRVSRSLFDVRLDPEKQRGSLTSMQELDGIIERFPDADASAIRAVAPYAWIAGQLRNRIHSLPLGTEFQLSRTYG
ncbi:hypothetical protein, partial [Cellulomonas sp. NPDC058312]|uniref:hypothetical protein n=1 Tax=Cellulomonas sp. NPDC058312 TaxID=3346441 RepID=UPI0036E55128